MIKNENIFFKKMLYVVRLEPTISTLTAIRSIQMARRDRDWYRIRKYLTNSEINTFHNVCKSKISFTELYEFIQHIHECQFNFVYLYCKYFIKLSLWLCQYAGIVSTTLSYHYDCINMLVLWVLH